MVCSHSYSYSRVLRSRTTNLINIAENYYGADYPDEDLPWDDEFDVNPYQYRTGNASDLEDFDERDYNGEK